MPSKRTGVSSEKELLAARETYQGRKTAGLCTRCGKRKPVEGKLNCESCAKDVVARSLKSMQKVRHLVLGHYGVKCGEKYQCACCLELFDHRFIHLDHVNNDGAEHRRQMNNSNRRTGTVFYQLRDQGFPEGYQVLCANCNLAKGFYGKCPHAEEYEQLIEKLAAVPLTY